ncbi:YcdB/YcdC domain-containing protein [Clostridium sp. FP1]|uniref:YcdB/YcdC domain-containing protein n=1 Tax=Clostridium sp. FP1 TaxID=2724076 RepID=UPI0013E96709|nr:YcdB/YcdC domain-containing protein [Clostridium sp. FP1]MBZ9636529.1 S-layer homology domain-containing protein [Clostridium sp. FP1]
MNRKKIFSILLASALTVTSTTSTFAKTMTKPQIPVTPIVNTNTTTGAAITKNSEAEKSVKISKEKAKEIAKGTMKTYFNTEIDESKFTQTSNFNTSNYNGKQISSWNINWQMNNMEKTININVTLNAETGEVTQVNNYERKINEENAVPTMTAKEAQKISDDFVSKIQPKKYNESNKKDYNNLGNHGSPNYNFAYVNKVNGIEFDGNNINIEVDGVAGKVVSYYSNWNADFKFPEIKGMVDSETAVEAFKTEAKMTLKYMAFTQEYMYYENKRAVKAVYVPEFNRGNVLDAKDGKFMDPFSNGNIPVIKNLNDKERADFYNKSKVVTTREKAIEEEEARTIIKNFINNVYGQGYAIEGLGYQEYTENFGSSSNKTWNAYFNKGDASKYNEGGNISIDALTGEILSINKNSNEDYNGTAKFQAKLSWEQAYTKAIEAVAKYYPGIVKQIKTEQPRYKYNAYDKMGERNYYFNFSRLENGIEFNDNSINVGFSAVTGEMNNLNCNWDKNIKFPDIKNVISKKNVSETMFSKYKPVLVYTQINKSDNPEKPELEIKLAYKLSDANGMYDYTNIDALTGKFLNYGGENIDQNIELFKEKIKGSKAEKELSILASKGLIETGDFKLDKKTTQIDLIKMLVNARGYTPYMADKTADLKFSNIAKSDVNYKYLQLAVSYGIMENSDGEFIGDRLVTREELAKTLVKYTNYSKLAQHSELFKINYKDAANISKDNVGYVAIAEAFRFIQIENNEFKPKENTTMEQLAIGVYHALNNVRNTQY